MGERKLSLVLLTPKLLQNQFPKQFLCNGGHYTNSFSRESFCVIGWQWQDLITHRNTHYITQINSPENILVYIIWITVHKLIPQKILLCNYCGVTSITLAKLSLVYCTPYPPSQRRRQCTSSTLQGRGHRNLCAIRGIA